MTRHGRKNSEIGLVPESWSVRPLRDVSERIMVGIASAATHAYRTKGIPLLRNMNIKAGWLDDRDVLAIDPAYELTFSNKRLRGGDLLTVRTGYPGITCVVPEKYFNAQSFTTLITRPARSTVAPEFLCYFMNSDRGRAFFDANQIGGAQKNVNVAMLATMFVPVPPIAEQNAIARVLSDVDALIAALDQLIAKKRDLKRAAMQQLLSGKTRLSQQQGTWTTTAFGELARPRATRVESAAAGDSPCIELEHLEPESGRLLGLRKSESMSLKTVFQQGDVLFGKLRAYLRKYWLAEFDGVCSTEIWALASAADRVDSRYLFQLVKSEGFIECASGGYGTHMPRSDWNVVRNYPVLLPPIAEQRAIADVLDAMDDEIAALKDRHEKTQLLKQGMMQELLTGRTRLVDAP